MFTLERIETFSQDIKKSRFIASAATICDEQAARDFICRHSDAAANHNCWAWRVGQAYRFNDDGEPSGTAGKPILQAIDGQSLDNVAVVVTRWFGGILLGSGGLMRAYGGTAALCLRAATKVEIVAMVEARIECVFADLALVKARLGAIAAIRIDKEIFTETGAEMTVALPSGEAQAIARMLIDITSGRASVVLPQ
jgi:uncharacterized YigZ family protein